MTEQWFAFKADNAQPRYCYGTAAKAEKYTAVLNEDREVDRYSAYPLTEAEHLEMHLPDCRVPGLTWIEQWFAFQVRCMRTRYGLSNPN